MSNILQQGADFVSGAIALPVLIKPGVRTVYFPDDATLRGKTIKHIDICDEIDKDLSGLPVYKADTFNITFFEKGTQTKSIDALPSELLQTSTKKGNRIRFNNVFDFPASYISLSENKLDRSHVVYFVFWYDEPAVSLPINTSARKKFTSFESTLTKPRTYFLENEELRNAKIRSILFSKQARTATGKESIKAATLNRAFITLRRGNLQFVRNLPLYLLAQRENAYLINLQNIRFDFTNSYIELVDAQQTDYKSVFFNVIVEE